MSFWINSGIAKPIGEVEVLSQEMEWVFYAEKDRLESLFAGKIEKGNWYTTNEEGRFEKRFVQWWLEVPEIPTDEDRQIKIILLGEPVPKQSTKFRIVTPKGKKPFVATYQPKELVKAKEDYQKAAKVQLPRNWKMLDKPVSCRIRFVFPFPKSTSKKVLKAHSEGEKQPKTTKPDGDNLMKLPFDSFNKIVYFDDARVWKVEAEKIYGHKPMSEFIFQF